MRVFLDLRKQEEQVYGPLEDRLEKAARVISGGTFPCDPSLMTDLVESVELQAQIVRRARATRRRKGAGDGTR
jgi:hypothetical protein